VTGWVAVPLLLSLLLAMITGPTVRLMSPRTARPSLVVAAGLAALASTWGLVLLAATLLDDVPPISELVDGRSIGIDQAVPGYVALAAASALALSVVRLAKSIRSRRLAYRTLRRLCEQSTAEELVVVAAAQAQAVAVPGRCGHPGFIVVTSGMLAALPNSERAVLLAHERAHLRGHHHWQRAIVNDAAALNPFLSPTRDAVAFLLERCADESAAEAVGNRSLTARSLVRAALVTTSSGIGAPLAFERPAITERVAALHAPPPPRRRLLAAGVVLLGVSTALAALHATITFAELIEHLSSDWV
jgi:beta-lactamase regulating signal transducer with metallopeptidase domain